MLTRRRLLLALGAIVVLAVAYTGWITWQVQRDLSAAERSVDDLTASLESDDTAARDAAIEDLQSAASSASSSTDGLWWSVMTKVPLVGDDAAGVRGLSASLDTLASEAITPLADSVATLDGISAEGRVDLEKIASLQQPVAVARSAVARASAEVVDLDSAGYAGALRTRFDDYVERLDEVASTLTSAETAVEVLPGMLGADGPRDYLLLFQNNAEIRATGGMPGSWAQLHADDGSVELRRQGTAGDFPVTDRPVIAMTDEEEAVYGVEQGIYFQNPGFNPDFPRAAEFWQAHWDRKFPDVPIDGVMALDPVGLSYLLTGTGPVQVGDLQLTSDNLVEELLNKPYLTLDPLAQDALFQESARAIFQTVTGDVAAPLELVRAFGRASRESRLLVAPFDDVEAAALAGSGVEGALPLDDRHTPYVDIDVNDTTGSKMSYYLRYRAEVQATSCESKVQEMRGSMSLNQVIAPAEAADLPVSVTGGGFYGVEPGTQLVTVRIRGPHGGTVEDIKVNGRVVDIDTPIIDTRPIATLAISLETRDDVVISWTMQSGSGQDGDGEMSMTPSVVAGNRAKAFNSAC